MKPVLSVKERRQGILTTQCCRARVSTCPFSGFVPTNTLRYSESKMNVLFSCPLLNPDPDSVSRHTFI